MDDLDLNSPEDLFGASASKPINVFPILLELASGKWIILLSGLVCAFAVWLYMLRAPTTFRAEAKIIPPSSSKSLSGITMLNQLGGGSDASAITGGAAALQARPQADVFLGIMKAWPVELAMVKQFDLVKLYNAHTEELAMLALANHVTLVTSKEDFITVSVIDSKPQRAADMANAYVEKTREFLRSLAYAEASQRHTFYEAQLSKASEDLAQAELNFKKVQQSSGMIELDTQSKTMLETAATLRAQITAKEVQLQTLRSYSTESNAQVQLAESELAALRGQLSDLESNGQGGFAGKGLKSVPETEIAFLHAERDLKYQEGLYDQLTKQFEGSRIDEARDAPIIQVIEPARVPSFKFGPRRGANMRYGFGIGILLGIAFVFLRRWFSSWSPETIARLTELRQATFRMRS